ncbi:MAG: hypothetical protein ACOYM9_18795 [Bradymonadia bacterium]
MTHQSQILGGVVAILAGCVADFPTYVGKTESTSDSAVSSDEGGLLGGAFPDGEPWIDEDTSVDAPPDASDLGLDPRLDAEIDLGRPLPDFEVVTFRDVAVEDVAPAPDAAVFVEPRAALRIVGGDTPLGCGPHDIALAWETAGLSRCDLRAVPPVFSLNNVPLPQVQVDVAGVLGRVEFTLECTTAEGVPLRAGVTLNPLTGLPPTRELANRSVVRAEQRRCASVKGQTLVPDSGDEGFVFRNAASATQVCRCLGYGVADQFDPHPEYEHRRCFDSPRSKVMGDWRADGIDGQWFNAGARDRNDCIGLLRCAQPVEFCADRYAP